MVRSIRLVLIPLLLGAILSGCAPSRPTPATVPVLTPEEISRQTAPNDSLKVDFILTWKRGAEAGTVDALLFYKPNDFGRVELRGPMGIVLASLLWDRSGWQAWIPSEEILFEGEADLVPESITFGLGELRLDSLAGIVLGEAQHGRVRIEREEGWLQVNARPPVRNPDWGKWVRKIELPGQHRKIDLREMVRSNP